MSYSVKWVIEKLGITRDMLRYYEKEKLISTEATRNLSNNYREYDDKDIERIWCIKLLISIGFSAKEIRAFGEDPNFNFYEVITGKVKQLEEKHEELSTYLEFAKTIKMTGQIPNVTHMGIVKFEDFIEYSRQNWNAFNDPCINKWTKVVDVALRKNAEEWDETDLYHLVEFLGDIDPDQMAYCQTLSGYCRVIVDLMPLGYRNDVVQRIVQCLYECALKGVESQYKERFTPLFFARNTIPSFVDSDIAKLNEKIYGTEGCSFIVQALAYFGCYDLDN